MSRPGTGGAHVRVAIVGLGAIGREVWKAVHAKAGLALVAVADPALVGRDAGDVAGTGASGVKIVASAEEAFAGDVDVALVLTSSGVAELMPIVESSVISYTDINGLRKLRDQGSLKDGMLPKAAAIESAIRGGVRRVHVITYKSADSLLAEVFTNEGTGTLVVADLDALSPAEHQSAAANA